MLPLETQSLYPLDISMLDLLEFRTGSSSETRGSNRIAALPRGSQRRAILLAPKHKPQPRSSSTSALPRPASPRTRGKPAHDNGTSTDWPEPSLFPSPILQSARCPSAKRALCPAEASCHDTEENQLSDVAL